MESIVEIFSVLRTWKMIALLACGAIVLRCIPSQGDVAAAAIAAYRNAGLAIATRAPGTCTEVRAELLAVHAAWLPVWDKLGAVPPPMPELRCSVTSGPSDGGIQ
jgi:hypothetical protein